MSSASDFVGINIQGGLLPSELLSQLTSRRDIDGSRSSDYGLAAGETVREAANRKWAYLTGVWRSFREALHALDHSDRATSLTRDRWLQIVLAELDFGRIPATPAGGLHTGGKDFPISHVWQHVPVHLLGARISLDSRTAGVAGAAGQAPQSMMQDFLNRSDEHLWGILSNGLVLRLLRDSTSMVGSSYVEFDLEAIFDGELFSDFFMLFTLCHASRFEVQDEELGATSCWLEQWRQMAFESGSRALEQLREGVVAAIETLGTGFLAHPHNSELRHDLENGILDRDDFNHALLRVIYRLLFCFVAEDRGLLLDPNATPEAKSRYNEYFSMTRLRSTARRRRGGHHADRWQALQIVWDGLASPTGRPELGLVGIGGLFEQGPLDVVRDASLSNEALLSAVRSLSVITEKGTSYRRTVNHRDLGAEELGGIYEALLEYVPHWDPAARQYRLGDAAGNVRKTSGSYYTPSSLIESLLDSALDPVLDRAEAQAVDAEDRAAQLLAITVVDPACGSGHFLVAAAKRIAKRVAAARVGDPEPPVAEVRAALREVVSRCIYGVDINPLSAELAKVSLWLEAMEPGKPLAFLDAQIKVGNSLIGATPALIDAGIPQEAFKPLEGDDKKLAAGAAKENKEFTSGQQSLFDAESRWTTNTDLAAAAQDLQGLGTSLIDVHVQQQRLRDYLSSSVYHQQRLLADAWCAAFVWPHYEGAAKPLIQQRIELLQSGGKLSDSQRETVEQLSADYRFFHWHVEFPQIFPTEDPDDGSTLNELTGWYGGFDVVLGNPPWEHIELKEQEFFASRDTDIAEASGATRKRLIENLADTNEALALSYAAAKREIDGLRHFAAQSGRFPLCGRGRIKTDTVFAEMSRHLLADQGRVGIIVPTGIATDATTQYFFKDLLESKCLVSLFDFENSKPLFEGVLRLIKFSLLTLVGRGEAVDQAEFAFFVRQPADLLRDNVRFELTPEEIRLLNPNTGTCPVFRSRRDAEITLGIYKRVPVLINENDPENGNPWGIKFMQGLFNMTSDSELFYTRQYLEEDGWELNGNVFEKRDGGGGAPIDAASL